MLLNIVLKRDECGLEGSRQRDTHSFSSDSPNVLPFNSVESIPKPIILIEVS